MDLLKQKIGQLFMIAVWKDHIDEETAAFIKEYKIGNIAVTSRNGITTEDFCSYISTARKMVYDATGIYPFINIDQEGGWVTRFYEGAALISNAMGYAAIGVDREKMVDVGKKLGKILRAIGCNQNNAPVLDVNMDPGNPIIGTRSYGDNPEKVAELGVGFALGLESEGVNTAVKHFPGHGNVHGDTHLQGVHNDTPAEVLKKTEFLPFQRAFDAGIGAIMTAHITFDAYTDRPATMSKEIVTDLLRGEMGFDGVVVTDSMVMQAISNAYPHGESAVQAILAGCDILLYYPCNIAQTREAVEAVYRAVENGRIPMAQIDAAYNRICRQKEKYKVADCEPNLELALQLVHEESAVAEAFADKLQSVTCLKNDEILDNLSDKKILCISPVCEALRGVEESRKKVLSFAQMLADALPNVMPQVSSLDGMTPEVVTAIAGEYDVAIVGIFNADLKISQLEILKAVQQQGRPVIAVLLNSPYDYKYVSDCNAVVTAFEYTTLSAKALVQAIKTNDYRGNLPVRLA